jgi:hypothetical protein
MRTDAPREPAVVGRMRPDEAVDAPPPPGQGPLALVGLTIGLLLMGMQLWLLTIALELYLGGSGGIIWQIALASGAIFGGGLLMLRRLRRRPRGWRGALDAGRGPRA